MKTTIKLTPINNNDAQEKGTRCIIPAYILGVDINFEKMATNTDFDNAINVIKKLKEQTFFTEKCDDIREELAEMLFDAISQTTPIIK